MRKKREREKKISPTEKVAYLEPRPALLLLLLSFGNMFEGETKSVCFKNVRQKKSLKVKFLRKKNRS
jgi:hypothetical protein